MRFQLIRTYRGHQDTVCALAAVPGYARVVSASHDGLLKVWDLRSDSSRILRDGAKGYPTVLHVFPAGFFLASGNSEGRIKLWNLETGEVVRDMMGHQGAITSLAITHNGQRLLSGSEDHTMRIWDALRGTLMHVCNSYSVSVETLAVTPDDKIALAGGIESREAGGLMKAWNIETGDSVTEFHKMPLGGRDTAILQDGNQMIYTSTRGDVVIWNLYTGKTIRRIKVGAHTTPVVMALMPEQKLIAIGSQAPSVALWDLETGEKVYQFDEPSDQVTSLVITTDGRYVIAGCHDGSLNFYMRVS